MSGQNLSRGLAIAAMVPAALTTAASAEQAPSNPIDEKYPGSVVGFNPYGFHEELPNHGPKNIQDQRLKDCVTLVLGSFREASFKAVESGRKVKTSVKADNVAECTDIVDRTVDIHFDMDRKKARDIIGPDGKPIKETGLDPNSKVRVLNSDNTIKDRAKIRLFEKPKRTTKRFQMVIGINATDKSTGEDYRKTYIAKAR